MIHPGIMAMGESPSGSRREETEALGSDRTPKAKA